MNYLLLSISKYLGWKFGIPYVNNSTYPVLTNKLLLLYLTNNIFYDCYSAY